MRQYIGVALTALAFVALLTMSFSPLAAIPIAIYVAGLALILWPEKRRPAAEAPPPPPQPEAKPATPEELKKRPIRAPEV
ncbi:MAG: hypothetical protein TU35_002925 [Thermoproteus sp. AZ2]|uniref:Uncharacterized protein n=1 Tax=Thermoproteus sp. AZ2 TaxID=1609232 RepID=A0ACC6UZF5_9CREN